VKGQEIVKVNCSKNDLSLRWSWTGLRYILNLKTLKCLQWNNTSQLITASQCNASDDEWQRWFVNIAGKIMLAINEEIKTEELNFSARKLTLYKGNQNYLAINSLKTE
jgi:hypothetical protein